MSITVVMTTYNGAGKLLPQLLSLKNQSRKADEVLIFDDCSRDKSVEIIQNFIYEHHLYDWTLIENARNKGWRQNFADAINTARGDLIFLCDQDDDWNVNKIETMTEILDSRPEITMLASNYSVRYEKNAAKIRWWMLKEYGKERIEKVLPSGMMFEPMRPGCTYAFRKELISVFNRIWQPEDAHDRVLWDIALLKGGLYILNEKLITQVRFGDNSTPANQTGGSGRLELIRYRREFAERCLNELEGIENRQWLEEYIRVAKAREKALADRDLMSALTLSRSYAYTPLQISWVLDVLSVLRKQ